MDAANIPLTPAPTITKDGDDLKIGDKIMIQGETTGSVTHIVESMQVDGADVDNVSRDSNVGVLMPSKVRKNDFVYKLVERSQQ